MANNDEIKAAAARALPCLWFQNDQCSDKTPVNHLCVHCAACPAVEAEMRRLVAAKLEYENEDAGTGCGHPRWAMGVNVEGGCNICAEKKQARAEVVREMVRVHEERGGPQAMRRVAREKWGVE